MSRFRFVHQNRSIGIISVGILLLFFICPYWKKNLYILYLCIYIWESTVHDCSVGVDQKPIYPKFCKGQRGHSALKSPTRNVDLSQLHISIPLKIKWNEKEKKPLTADTDAYTHFHVLFILRWMAQAISLRLGRWLLPS
jgi:hypothetical protein